MVRHIRRTHENTCLVSTSVVNSTRLSIRGEEFIAGRSNGSERISRSPASSGLSFVPFDVRHDKYFPGQWATLKRFVLLSSVLAAFDRNHEGKRRESPRPEVGDDPPAHPATRRHKPINSLLPSIFLPFPSPPSSPSASCVYKFPSPLRRLKISIILLRRFDG